MYEAHFGVAMAGAVLNTLNTRLDAEAIAFMLDHGEAKVLLTDREFSDTIEKALALAGKKPLVIDVDDPAYSGGKLLGAMDYEQFIAGAIRNSRGFCPPTSGTRFRSTTRRAPPAIRKASFITIAARI